MIEQYLLNTNKNASVDFPKLLETKQGQSQLQFTPGTRAEEMKPQHSSRLPSKFKTK